MASILEKLITDLEHEQEQDATAELGKSIVNWNKTHDLSFSITHWTVGWAQTAVSRPAQLTLDDARLLSDKIDGFIESYYSSGRFGPRPDPVPDDLKDAVLFALAGLPPA